LRIADDGIGMDPGGEPHDRRTIGLDVMQALARQLDADLDIDGTHGVTIHLTFKPAPEPQEAEPSPS
jgi:nitrate/nitrite-specific signal transduction histidine kinase